MGIQLVARINTKIPVGERRAYRPPYLLRYGAVSELTQSGSARDVEDKNNNKSCQSNPQKKPCQSGV
jgi:hypothetical protein